MTITKKSIIITGASSGLGKALAIKYSQSNNNIRLFLLARNNKRLDQVVEICKNNGAFVFPFIVNVEDKEELSKIINDIAKHYGIDYIYAVAGVSAGTLDGMETNVQVEKIFATNLNGVLNTIMPAIPKMIERRSGKIILISSMAGLLGLSSSPSYSASKSAVIAFGQGLAGYLKQYNIDVSIIIPGYIKTPMTEVNNFPMPFMISAEKAATKIIQNVDKGKIIIAFPLTTYFMLKLLNLLPGKLIRYINSKMPGKPAFEDNSDEKG
ncbi:MAG: SDR family NAD(P)-dependent oxidoreductase [Rickettsiaceae bacterium]|nr:SDR family NAD(P)-dependent oxidoreductase [Rickettsiaceae bacterium]